MTYEYSCKIHGEFEVFQKISDPPLEKCPHCEKENINSEQPQRLISRSGGFILSGGGWGNTGYN